MRKNHELRGPDPREIQLHQFLTAEGWIMVLANATCERQGDHDKRVLISRKSQAYTVGGHSAQDEKLNFNCERNKDFNWKVKHHVYVKRQTRICTTWVPFTCRLLSIISTNKLVVSRNFSSIRIVLSCFYLHIFYFEKFSTWIWRLPSAVCVKLKLSTNNSSQRQRKYRLENKIWHIIILN